MNDCHRWSGYRFPLISPTNHGSDYFLDDIVRDMRGNSYILFVWI